MHVGKLANSNPLFPALRTHTFDCPAASRFLSSPRRMERRGGGCCCCNAVAGTAAILELNSAAVALHHAPVAARRAARCCFVFVGGSASRLAAMLSRDALAGALTLDDHRCHWLALLRWKPRVAAACMFAQLVVWETAAALVIFYLCSTLASVVQMAALQQLVSTASLLLPATWTVDRQGRSRDGHLARVFASPL